MKKSDRFFCVFLSFLLAFIILLKNSFMINAAFVGPVPGTVIDDLVVSIGFVLVSVGIIDEADYNPLSTTDKVQVALDALKDENNHAVLRDAIGNERVPSGAAPFPEGNSNILML